MKRAKILMIDDEPALCRTIKANLEETGKYKVRVETKGKNALPVIHKFKPDLLILDVIMPKKDGVDVARQLKKDDIAKNIPIVFFTAVVSKEDARENNGIIGGHPVVPKPATTEELVRVLDAALNQSHE